MKKVRLIYNPRAGMGITSVAMSLDRIATLYASRGFELEQCKIDFSVPASTLVEGLNEECYDHLLIAGGDGTVNYVVNAMFAAGIDLPIGVIPAGTANDFVSAIGIHGGVVEACRQILDCKPRLTDVGVANGRYFVNVFSFGVFTNVSQHTPTHLKNVIGKAAYVVGGAVDFVTMHQIPLEIRSDGGDWDGNALIALAFNGRTAGNFPLARMAEVDDGMLDVLVLKAGAVPALTAVPTFLQCIIGANNTLPRDVLHFRCSRMTISSTRDEHTDVDGQPGPSLPVELECRAGALLVLRP